MRNLISIFLVCLVALQCQGASVRQIKKSDAVQSTMYYLGEYKKPMTTLDARNEVQAFTQQTSHYFLSQNAAGFATAEADCRAQLGNDATLLYIETEEELKIVADYIRNSDDTGSTYWVGGRFDPDSDSFQWGNGVAIGAFAPWDAGFPDTRAPITRVTAYTVGSLKLRTQFQTVSNRYICELQLGSKSNGQFKYVGQYKSPETRVHRGSTMRQTSFYFLSQNAAGFQTAENDCKAYLGEDATLLYIETQEELGNVTQFLRGSDDTGSTYWIGGRFDTDKQTFLWGNGAEVGPWAPWDAGMPDSRTILTRISAYTVGSIKFRTQFNTVSNRYICELGAGIPEEEAKPCYIDNDLVVVVDSSGSIGQENYMVALEFTTRLALAWADNPNNRVAVLTYASSVESIISLPENLTVAEIRDKIYKAPYLAGGTASHLALDRALQEFNSNTRAVPLNLVFLTDGASNDAQATIAAANRIHDANIRAVSVGIGSSLNPTELLAIAGGKQDHVFNTGGFDDLLKLLLPVSDKVC